MAVIPEFIIIGKNFKLSSRDRYCVNGVRNVQFSKLWIAVNATFIIYVYIIHLFNYLFLSH